MAWQEANLLYFTLHFAFAKDRTLSSISSNFQR